MRFLSTLFGLVLVASTSQAEVKKYPVEEFLHVRFEGNEAATVYQSLDLSTQQLSEGKGKSFSTTDGSIELNCFNRHFNATAPFACHFIFDMRGLSNQVFMKPEAKGMRFVLKNTETAKELYEALRVPVAVLEGKTVKYLEIENGEVVIDCRLDARRSDASPE
ncbi:hypothetical protein EBT16_11250, partial [bacterium]|nr:hypothetical protein [bacterium]